MQKSSSTNYIVMTHTVTQICMNLDIWADPQDKCRNFSKYQKSSVKW